MSNERTRLVVVTGPGRSGTSSVTGALQLHGLTIPEPIKPPDDGNVRGSFEPERVVDFHERHVNAIPVRTLDSRPYAADIAVARAREAGIAEDHRTWLAGQVGPAQLLVTDPRLTWVHPIWVEVAEDRDGAARTPSRCCRPPAHGRPRVAPSRLDLLVTGDESVTRAAKAASPAQRPASSHGAGTGA